MALILSAPTTTTFLYRPLSINAVPVVTPYKKPEHAAPKSKPNAFRAPTLSVMRLAVAGNIISAVTVQQIRQSISLGSIPLFWQRSRTAGAPRSEVAFPSPFKILLSEIPVRVLIHSSLVSTIFSRSALVSLFSGTHPPTAVIAAVTRLLMVFGFRKKWGKSNEKKGTRYKAQGTRHKAQGTRCKAQAQGTSQESCGGQANFKPQ